MNELLLYFSYTNKGNSYEVFKDLVKKKKVGESHIKQVLSALKSQDVKYITVFDKEYPKCLKDLKYAPYVLYYKGNLDLLKSRSLCITADVMTENVSAYIEKSLNQYSNQFCLVTTDFSEVDRKIVAHFRQKNQPVIHVLANGHGYLNKESINENELYISQYPPLVNPKMQRFKERNTLLAGIGRYLVIFGSKSGSGIINLASNFADMNKEVYCYPSTDLNDGNNFLLKHGANLITHITDIVMY